MSSLPLMNSAAKTMRCRVLARKRPLNRLKLQNKQFDVVTVVNGMTMVVHYAQRAVDGVEKRLRNVSIM